LKGTKYDPEWAKVENAETSMIRLTSLKYPSHHLYFTNKSFTSDEKYIVFVSERGDGFNLYRMNRETFSITKLTENRNLDYFPFISWQKDKVFFGEKSELWYIDLQSLEETKLLSANELVGKPVRKISGTFQSYDGRKLIAFYEADNDYGLILLDLASQEARIIVRGQQPVRHCQFCPLDSNLILYAHEGEWATIKTRMWLVRADGSDNHPVRKQASEEEVGHEFWANTRKRIYFTVYRGKKSEIRWFDIESQEEKTLLAIDNCHAAINAKDTLLVTDNNRGAANELFLIDLHTKQPRILCHSKMLWKNGRFHPHPTFSPSSKEVIFTSVREGTPAVYLAKLAK